MAAAWRAGGCWKDDNELSEEIGMGIDENVVVHHEDGLE